MDRRSLPALALLGVVLAFSLFAGAAQAAERPSFGAAIGVVVRIPGDEELTIAAVSGPPREFEVLERSEYPGDGSVVTMQGVMTDVHRGPGANVSVDATTTIDEAILFAGEIEATGFELLARASLSGAAASGRLDRSSLESLLVGGEPVKVVPNLRIALGDWGYLVALEEAVVPHDSAGDGYRGFVTGLHVYLTSDHGGLPAGSEILVGYAEAAASAPEPPPAPLGAAGGTPRPPEPEPQEAPAGPLGGSVEPPSIVRNPPADVRPAITGQGYVFPVYGTVSYSDDFGAPRSITGWHHGNDIFASLGSPVLAVASGTVYSVGWNPVGGWRLWLRDSQGNEYYYAHLSAYSPLARNGGVVRAGDVLGFVGDSGDARGTPYHLHFEVHPAGLLGLGYDGVVNPYEYLRAWAERTDADIAVAALEAGPAPRPGAIVRSVEDISTASGLDPGAFLRLLGAAGTEVPFLLPPGPQSVIGASPGFS
jgi:murein DD-endopeptidase MepM/ murein hydrolase activator NlpD